jgi:cyclophilin family peptidyl-prolyl cis-trans isomerase
MHRRHLIAAIALTSSLLALPSLAAEQDMPTPTAKEILAKSTPAEWRTPDPQNLLVMQLPTGRVVIELAQDFTPLHAANIRMLVRQHYFDGLAIVRVQDNFVTQWGDPNDDENGDKSKLRSLGKANKTVAPEFSRAINPKQSWTPLPDGDVYAPQVGFSGGFPVGRDPASGREWPAHCYGMVGVARDVDPRSGSGSSLYAVIGSARRLDHNLAIAGRVLEGMPLLSSRPRGGEPMGFYDKPAQRLAITSVQIAADMPAEDRANIEVLRTSSPAFAALIDARRNGHNAFYPEPVGKVGLCSIEAPVRVIGKITGKTR